MKDVWCETFPNEDKKVKSRIEKRKQIAKQQKEYEMSMEDQERMQQEIPEWKRQSLVVTDQQAEEEEKQGLFKKLRKGVKERVSQTEAAQKFYQSEEYKKIEAIRSEMNQFKSNLKEEIDNTQNPLVQTSRRAVDLAFTESGLARAIKEMQKYDPEFDLQELHYEAEEIFKEFYCNYLNGNLQYIEKVCGKAGLAIAKSEINRRNSEGWKYKYDDILNINHPNFLGGLIPEKSPPQFTFTIEVQEIDCKVNNKDG